MSELKDWYNRARSGNPDLKDPDFIVWTELIMPFLNESDDEYLIANSAFITGKTISEYTIHGQEKQIQILERALKISRECNRFYGDINISGYVAGKKARETERLIDDILGGGE